MSDLVSVLGSPFPSFIYSSLYFVDVSVSPSVSFCASPALYFPLCLFIFLFLFFLVSLCKVVVLKLFDLRNA